MFAAQMTFRHFSVSSATNLSNAGDELPNSVNPELANRFFISGFATAALISFLSSPMISSVVFFGTPRPYQELAS
jgi:hypothetical protein